MSLQLAKLGTGVYVSDPDAATDHGDSTQPGSIANLMADVNSVGGGVVQLVPGTYTCQQSISFPGANIELRGCGLESIIDLDQNTYNSTIVLANQQNSIVRNLMVSGDQGGSFPNPAVYVGGTGCVVENVFVNECAGIGIHATSGATNSLIQANWCVSCDQTAIYNQANYVTIQANYFLTCYSTYIFATGNIGVVADNVMEVNGVTTVTMVYVTGDDQIVKGNNISAGSANPTYYFNSSSDRVTFVGNSIKGSGITATDGTAFRIEGDDCSIHNNHVDEAYELYDVIAGANRTAIWDNHGSWATRTNAGTDTWYQSI